VKLAELYDREGNWDEAQKGLRSDCADFPDELAAASRLWARSRSKAED